MPQTTPFIRLDSVTLRVAEDRVFPNTSWCINEGEHWVVVGPNGSGKSTLLGAFDGRTPVVGGEVWYHFACTDPEESYPDDGSVPEERIAYVSQEDQAALARSGSEYHQARWNATDAEAAPKVMAVLSKRTGASDHAIRRAATQVNIHHRLQHPLPALSNGELRRVLLAEALLRKPRLLVLDDPCAGLDTAARAHLLELIASLMKEDLCVVLVVRRAEEMPEGITHLLQVKDGRVVRQGPLETLRTHRSLQRFFAPTTPPPPTRKPSPPESGGSEVFSLKEVTVRYDKTVALDTVSWTVRTGERWALLGHNGSGKSTLLSLLTGDNLQAYANDVRLFGQRRGQGESIWDIRKRIGWLSPELQWHVPGDERTDHLIASGLFDTLGLQRSLRSNHRAQVQEWIARFQLPAKEPFAALGAGEQRMALLARALIKSPDLILLDEPCQGLDSAHRGAFHRALAKAMKGHPCALVYITHHAEELPPVVDRVFKLEQGRVVSDR